MSTHLDHLPTFLYRAFDAAGTLLYVGISYDTERRFKQHKYASPWWKDVARVTQEWYPDRRSALDAEREIIEVQRPPHNITMVEQVRRTQEGARPIRDHRRKMRQRFAGEIEWAHSTGHVCPLEWCQFCQLRELRDRAAAMGRLA